MGRRGLALGLVGLSIVACSSENAGTPAVEAGPESSDASGADAAVSSEDSGSDATQTQTQTVGAAGGTVSTAGAVLTIPAGALAGDVEITMNPSSDQVPAGYTGLSPVFTFGPAGTTFLVPATVVIKLSSQAPGAVIFLSNANNGYDALSTTVTADSATASLSRLGDGFAGELQEATDAEASSDVGPPADGAVADGATAVADGATAVADSGLADAAIVDAAPSDAGTLGIFATVDGTPTAFTYNARATLLQAWWKLAADDSASPTHWTMQLTVPTNAGTLMCSGGIYPAATYVHYTGGAVDAGTADATFTTSSTGASCTIDETTTATTQGQHAQGTFSGTLVYAGDAGAASHTLTSGSYNVVVP
jgi:ZU5 domain